MFFFEILRCGFKTNNRNGAPEKRGSEDPPQQRGAIATL